MTIYKLINVYNLKLFCILSQTGEFIYILIHASEDALKKEAERIGFFLEYQLGASDILSLEPVDENLRPIRFLKVL